jgi:hypothetical protein
MYPCGCLSTSPFAVPAYAPCVHAASWPDHPPSDILTSGAHHFLAAYDEFGPSGGTGNSDYLPSCLLIALVTDPRPSTARTEVIL